MLSDDDTTLDPLAVDARDIGGRIGIFVEWADSNESDGNDSEERRFGCRELLGEMSIYEDDVNASERKQFNQLGMLASLEHDDSSFTCLRCKCQSTKGLTEQEACAGEKGEQPRLKSG